VARWNGVTQNARFRAGQPITLMLAPPRSAKARPAPRAAKAAAPKRATAKSPQRPRSFRFPGERD
jgi:hypothetical protein